MPEFESGITVYFFNPLASYFLGIEGIQPQDFQIINALPANL